MSSNKKHPVAHKKCPVYCLDALDNVDLPQEKLNLVFLVPQRRKVGTTLLLVRVLWKEGRNDTCMNGNALYKMMGKLS